ncbi:MAG: FtsX-like permease family protein [Lachnospiraceae bacterium]|nr:FtsX-like permease family protein [Lachnospiraceae bacterium]
MFRIMLQKLWQKKWMNLSLLLGCVLFVATAVSFPLYQKTAYDRMLQDEFSVYLETNGKWPMLLRMTATCNKDSKDTIGKMERFTGEIYEHLGVPAYRTILSYSIQRSQVTPSVEREDAGQIELSLSAMTDLEKYARLVTGSVYSEDGIDDTGAIEVIVPQATLVQKGLLPDETLTFDRLKTVDGDPIRIHIVGVFTGGNDDDFYFQENPDLLFGQCYMEPNLFRSLFTGENAYHYMIMVSFYDQLDYRQVTSSDIQRIRENTAWLCGESPFRSVLKEPDYRSILEEYTLKQIRISATLTILQIPVLVLLAAFLLMISGQMYEMERNEISVIKSRGSSRGQILLLYLYQGAFLSVLGAVFGVPLAILFARLLSSTRNFLEFNPQSSLPVNFSGSALVYAIAAAGVTLLSISVPAIRHSKVTIVNLKQQKAVGKKPLWQKLFIDLLLIGVSLYGFYSFRRSLGSLSETVLSGESLDPLLYISSSLFIVGTGLFFLRIQPFVVKLLYYCFRRICGPAGYISFMENTRNGHKMQLIMLFLIMTISLGMFHATVARTILENAVENTDYLDGTDVIIKENWVMMQDENGSPTGVYTEPDTAKYLSMDFADAHTKVLYDDRAYVKQKGNSRMSLTFMAIHTKEFGEMTALPAGVNEKSWHTYLNELAVTEQGLLVSRNFSTVQNVEIGDSISFFNGDAKALKGTVVDFIDYFPSYRPTITVINPDGSATTEENYLIVANYSDIRKRIGMQPYEQWISLKEGTTPGDVYDFITTHNMTVRKYVNRANDVEHTMTDPLLQGTNGILTMGFVVTLLLCAVGYLIFWIMSIRERELIFGVLRACGFHKGEIVRMLLMEQLFSGVFSVLAGIGIGKLTSSMFVPMLQASYATSEQVLPMKLITRASDLYKLYGIVGAVMLVCIFVLIFLLFHMNVTKALKLGEE